MTNHLLYSIKTDVVVQSSDTIAHRLASLKVEAATTSPTAINTQKVASIKLEAAANAGASIKHHVAKLMAEVAFSLDPGPPPPPPPDVINLPNTYRPKFDPCIKPQSARFRKFWATQPNACPPDTDVPFCIDPLTVQSCSRAGLVLKKKYDPAFQTIGCAPDGGGALPDCAPPIIGAEISTDNYVAGLALNILGTNASQSKTTCGNVPGQRMGYWLDDITGVKSGTGIRYVPREGFDTAQQVAFVQMQCQADMQKLIKYGVARSVSVNARYAGRGTIELIVTITGVDDTTTVVNSSLKKIANAWVWNS